MITLSSKLEDIYSVGDTTARTLKKMGLDTVEKLIYHFPFRYDDFSQLSKIADLQIDQIVTVKVKIELINSRRSWRRRLTLTEALVHDESGTLKIIWFNQPYLNKNLKAGDEVYLSGRVSGDLLGRQLNNPSVEKVKASTIHTARLVPIYSITKTLTTKHLRTILHQLLPTIKQIPDYLPLEIRQNNKLISLAEALEQIHFPTDQKKAQEAQTRLRFDNLFLLNLHQQWLRKKIEQTPAPIMSFDQKKIKKFVADLPFTLTADQKKAAWEIIRDTQNKYPMNRLLNGDVGSGKTVVAVLAAYHIALNKYQTAILTPTSILAHQHYLTISTLLHQQKITICLLTQKEHRLICHGQEEKISNAELLKKIKTNKVHLIIGTHAILQKSVTFANLGLIVVDEQHRFGVQQRQSLKNKNQQNGWLPHFLSMTATPIPRTLALTVYGDLDLSILKKMPAGRLSIITSLVPASKRAQAYDFINKQIAAGRQVFVLCPLIDPSDKLGVKSATAEYERLDKTVFPHLRIGLLHGKLSSEEKNQVMTKFKNQETDLLVATSIIEVGIDIPNATIMMVEDADRFGLAQLHQFRGRVGRGDQQSYCLLFTNSTTKQTTDRLKIMTTVKDGFKLAEYDLKFRGAGNIFGTEQSGYFDYLLWSALTNPLLIKQAKDSTQYLLTSDPDLNNHPRLKEKITAANLDQYNSHRE
ncbi:MAG: DNA helicase RecG [Candidatus Komeilibacteria bacterium CG_4_10_14_0_2_um_filter_37_10]|uniref:ATP-dependent DNA helicase RecG n=1 Tax=Candidatus Komeilibacteria bacterium CG_4_10_14_0_2_um_filter_37_10 TaxID=1974470 RepID=A0A2M7VDA3_9BACT|nr:MAG: DNA helicase RecG [Candidatus Komeilibacteria bacterium CG_4_10_14_0_2_um_filter_37_10]